MKKLLISLLLVSCLCAMLLLPVNASQEGYVFDLRGIFDEEDIVSLNQEAEAIYLATGIAPYFIMTADQDGLECEDYVSQFAQTHGFYDDAVIVLDGEDAYYIVALGAAKDAITRDDLVTMRDAYSESETEPSGVRDYFNQMFIFYGTSNTFASEETSALLQMEPGPVIAPTPEETVAVDDTAEHSFRLVDNGGLLTADEEVEIAALLDEVSAKHEMDVVIVTESTLGGKGMMAFADDYYDYNGYADDGLLLLYCPNEGARYISTKGKAIDWFGGDNFDELAEKIKPYFERGDISGAFTAFAQKCDDIVDSKTGFPWMLVVLAVIAGALLSLLIPMNILKGELKSVRSKAAASDYVRSGSMNLTEDRDIFLYHTVTRTAKPKNNSSGSGTHTSSSGSSHGGGSF